MLCKRLFVALKRLANAGRICATPSAVVALHALDHPTPSLEGMRLLASYFSVQKVFGNCVGAICYIATEPLPLTACCGRPDLAEDTQAETAGKTRSCTEQAHKGRLIRSLIKVACHGAESNAALV